MIPLLSPGASSRGRTLARWATAAVVLVLVSGCTRGTGGQAGPTTTPGAGSSAAAGLAGLEVARAGSMSDYDRDAQFGDWIDADGDCQDTRQEILVRDLRQVVLSADGCRVASGVLVDPYTGTTISFTRGVATSAAVQIDHVVAAGNAWISGAGRLSQARRVQFYNDPLNLLAVDGPTNGAKSDSPADRWLPPEEGFRCRYVATQIAVKTEYHLTVTPAEKAAMTTVLAGCPDQPLPTGAPGAGPVTSDGRAGTGAGTTPQTSVPETPADGFANCAAARAAGAAPLRSGSPGYHPRLDRDGDGVACEN